jgi:AraC-like DNA-binding protein
MHSNPSPSEASLPTSTLDTRDLPNRQRFDRWRDSFAPMFDVELGADAERHGFVGYTRAYALPGLYVGASFCASQTIWHGRGGSGDPRVGDDPFVLHLHQQGRSRGHNGCREMQTGPGDISITDLGRPLLALDDGYRTLSLVIPRAALLPRLRAEVSPGGLVLPARSAQARILASHISTVWQVLPRLQADEAEGIAAGLLAAIAHGLGPSREALSARSPEQALTTLAAVTDYIETHLSAADLGPERLCRAFDCSRSHLYRLFEPLDGVVGYIGERRLQRAWRLLTAPSGQPLRIANIAQQCGFFDQSHFSRLFRRSFGMSPSEARRQLLPPPDSARRQGPLPVFHDWLSAMRCGGNAGA